MRLGSLAVTQAALLASALIPSSVVCAQTPSRILDEGTFLISKAGTPIGRESFRISRSTLSAPEAFRATAQVALGERRIAPTLVCDSTGAPISYDVAVQGGADPGAQLRARARPGRFTSMLRTSAGESAREYVVPTGVIVLDEDVVHQLYFVTMNGRRSGSVTLLAPRTGVQAVASLQDLGASSLDFSGKLISATHFALSSTGFPRREFWIDSAGRILRASIPERGILAQRDEPPR